MRSVFLLAIFLILGQGLQAQFKETTTKSKKSIEAGMKFLLKAQNTDGGFGVEVGMRSDPACSAMVGLVFLSEGSSPNGGLYQKEITKTTNYILNCIQKNRLSSGSQIEGDINRYANHYFVLLYLSQLYGEAGPALNKKIGPAVKMLVKKVHSLYRGNGNWGTGAYADNLGAITAWLSLHSSENAGFENNIHASQVRKYLYTFENNTSWLKQLHKSSSYLRISRSTGKRNSEYSKQMAGNIIGVMKNVPSIKQAGGEEYFSIFLLNECFIQDKGDTWERWYSTIRPKIIAVQNADGSWTGYSCIQSRIFCTACNVLTLTSPNRYLPTSDI